MRLSLITLGLVGLSQQASARLVTEFSRRSLGASPGSLYGHVHADSEVRKRADALLNYADLARRYAEAEPIPLAQAAGMAPSPQPSTIIPTINETQTSCMAALSKMNGIPSNPSGMSACYNIDLFDNSTGDFRAHVLVYKIGLETGSWTNLKAGSMSVSLRFPGASVAPGPSLSARSEVGISRIITRGNAPQELQDLVFVGQISMAYMNQTNNVTAMRAALDPDLQVTAKTADGEPLGVVLSSSEASFVDGFFSNLDATTTDGTSIPTPFVLPGTTLGIFPTGLVITCIWSLLFVSAVGAGTYGRMMFRDAYRRKSNPLIMAAMSGEMPSASKPAAYDKPSYNVPNPS